MTSIQNHVKSVFGSLKSTEEKELRQRFYNVCDSAFEKYNMDRIDAEVFSENTAARRVLEKIGFDFEGLHKKSVYKNGRVMDTVTYALLKN